MDRFYNLRGIFHSVIIASFLLGLSGCGYKASPFYSEDVDENVKIGIKKVDINQTEESCE